MYDHYSGALLGVISRIIKKEELAEEILQDVFLKIWDRIETYDAAKGKLLPGCSIAPGIRLSIRRAQKN